MTYRDCATHPCSLELVIMMLGRLLVHEKMSCRALAMRQTHTNHTSEMLFLCKWAGNHNTCAGKALTD